MLFFEVPTHRTLCGRYSVLGPVHENGRRSEGFDDDQHDDGHQGHYGRLVEPAVPYVGARVPVFPECLQDHAAPDVVEDQEPDQHELEGHPAGVQIARHVMEDGDAGQQRQYRTRRHDAPEKFALHDLEAFQAGPVGRHRVIHEQARQVEQTREPGDDENNVKRLDPEHVG